LKEVLVVPGFTQNLLSTSKLDRDGYDTLFSKGKVYIGKNFIPKDVCVTGNLKNGSYYVTIPKSAASSAASIKEWHLKLNHLNSNHLKKLGAAGMIPVDSSDLLSSCESCLIGKAKKGTVLTHSQYRSSRPGELIHSDLCGPIKPTSNRGFSYFMVFVDDCSRNCTVYLLKQKSEAFHAFSVFSKRAENRFGRPITFFHTDNEVVLKSKQFKDYFATNGITPMYSCRYSPNQNGVAERMILTLLNPVRTMLAESKLDKRHWCYALLYAAVIHNISPTSAAALVPFEIWNMRPPTYKHLAVFGQHCIVTVPLIDRQRTGTTKLSRGEKGTFLGFALNKKGYLIKLESGKVIDCQYQDVNFMIAKKTTRFPFLFLVRYLPILI